MSDTPQRCVHDQRNRCECCRVAANSGLI